MTIDRILQFLMEETDSEVLDDKAKSYMDRLLLRIMTSPALMSFLDTTQILKEGDDYIIELLFRKVPQEQVDVIKAFIAEPTASFSFEQKGQTHFAFRVKLKAKDLGGSENSEQGLTTGVPV